MIATLVLWKLALHRIQYTKGPSFSSTCIWRRIWIWWNDYCILEDAKRREHFLKQLVAFMELSYPVCSCAVVISIVYAMSLRFHSCITDLVTAWFRKERLLNHGSLYYLVFDGVNSRINYMRSDYLSYINLLSDVYQYGIYNIFIFMAPSTVELLKDLHS